MSLLRETTGWIPSLRLALLRAVPVAAVFALFAAQENLAAAGAVFASLTLIFALPSLVEPWARQRSWPWLAVAVGVIFLAVAGELFALAQVEYTYGMLARGRVDPAVLARRYQEEMRQIQQTPAMLGMMLAHAVAFGIVTACRLTRRGILWPAAVGAALSVVALLALKDVQAQWSAGVMGFLLLGTLWLGALTWFFRAVDWVERRALGVEPVHEPGPDEPAQDTGPSAPD